MRRAGRPSRLGLTLAEILVGTFVATMIFGMMLQVLRMQNSLAYSDEARLTAQKSIQLLFKNLDRIAETTSRDGVAVSPDGHTFSLQVIQTISQNGTHSWSPFLEIYTFDTKQRTLLKGEVPLQDMGLTHQPSLPAAVNDETLGKAVLLLRSRNKFKPIARNVDSFEVKKVSSVALEATITMVMKSGRHKDETVKGTRRLLFASSLDI